MPGWTTGDNFHNNIAYTPGTWIALHRICERHGVGDQFRIHYDPSHAILMGQDTRSIFQYLKDEGYSFLIGGFHVKGQVIDAKGVAAWGYGGQTIERGDWVDGKPSAEPADQVNAWKKQIGLLRTRTAGHGAARSARIPAKPHGGLAGSSTGGARTAAPRCREHALDCRTRIPERAHPGSRATEADSAGIDRLRPHASTKRRRACMRCSTRCWRRRAFRFKASAVRRIEHESRLQHGQPVAAETDADTRRGRNGPRRHESTKHDGLRSCLRAFVSSWADRSSDKKLGGHMKHRLSLLDRCTAPNENSVPVASIGSEPYSAPRRAECAKKRQSTSQGRRVSWDFKGARPWLAGVMAIVSAAAVALLEGSRRSRPARETAGPIWKESGAMPP